ncbi:restriction endonuclease subunit S [Desulfobulbus sp.]|uniref:restriction endonuclease subunit S n=1 Tax=Desulfobulbus sp. TaxID=895 RepID=UPI00286F2A67|nr:restriction endonuclease subunit S [Desulfobulbus sp.]
MNYPAYSKYKDSGVEWLGEVPEGWEVRPLYSIGLLRNGFPFKSAQFSHEGIPSDRLLRIRDLLSDDEKIYTEESCPESSYISNDDILIGMDGDFNVNYWTRGIAKLNQRMCAVIGKTKELTRFFYFLLPIPLKLINDVTFSTTVKHLSSYDVLHTNIALPTEDEIVSIIEFLDRETAQIDALVTEQEKLVTLLQEKRQAVISHAVTKGLNPDAPMKDSGVEWLGKVPEGWAVFNFRRIIARIEQGWSPNASSEPCQNGDWGVLKISAVKFGRFVQNENKALLDDVLPVEVYKIFSGDLLLTRANTPDLVGDCCVVSNDLQYNLMMSDLIYRVHLNSGVDAHSISYLLRSNFCRSQIKADARGSSMTMAKISQGHIKDWFVLIPPLPEQQAIVAYLDAETAKIDALITEAEKAIALLKERRSAIISAAVTGKIDVRDIPLQEAV